MGMLEDWSCHLTGILDYQRLLPDLHGIPRTLVYYSQVSTRVAERNLVVQIP